MSRNSCSGDEFLIKRLISRKKEGKKESKKKKKEISYFLS